jgi:hypothetical protein
MDPSGNLTLDASVDVPNSNVVSFAGDRFIVHATSATNQVRVYERDAAGWAFALELSGPSLSSQFRYGSPSVTNGSLLYASDPVGSGVDVFDISVPGTATLVDELVLAPGKIVSELVCEGDTVAMVAGVPAQLGFVDSEVLVYQRQGSGFVQQSIATLPPQYDLDLGAVLALEQDRLAIALPFGTVNDPCGRVLVLDRSGSQYVLGAEILHIGECSFTSSLTTFFGIGLDFRGKDELLISGGGQKGSRQYRSVGGVWQPGARHLLVDAGLDATYRFAGDWTVGRSRSGLQVFDNVNSMANDTVVCGATIASVQLDWALRYESGSYSLADGGGIFATNLPIGSNVSIPTVMVVGSERGLTTLGGGAASLCLGGQVRRVVMETSAVFQLAYARLEFDPVGFGIASSESVFFQAWRRELGFVGGVTTNALAITFAP